MKTTLASILGLILTACASGPDPEEPPEGILTEVTILTGGFVLYDGARVPLEEFLLDMRNRVRAAEDDPSLFPWVRIGVDPGVNSLTGQAMVQRTMDGLSASGVRSISLADS